jgi:anti-sigma regulatory factor (Ser/Thr protein kinase)
MRVALQLAPQPGQLRHVRALVEVWSEVVGVDWDSLPLVATELLSNALAASPADQSIELVLDNAGDVVSVSVADAGSGLKSSSFAPPPPTSQRGRGLAIVDRLADHLSIDRQDGYTRVTARKVVGRRWSV